MTLELESRSLLPNRKYAEPYIQGTYAYNNQLLHPSRDSCLRYGALT